MKRIGQDHRWGEEFWSEDEDLYPTSQFDLILLGMVIEKPILQEVKDQVLIGYI